MQHRSAALLAAITMAACGYSAPDEVINGQAVAAVHAPSADFTQYTTYTVTDTIQVFDNRGGTGQTYTRDAAQLVAQVRKNMDANGYQYVAFNPGQDPTRQPNLVIGLYAYLGDATYGGYWCDWYYWGYYPYGCGYYYYGTYNYGTLLMQMGDFKNAPPPTAGASLSTVWGSAAYNILGTQSYNLSQALAGIDRAFAQSPYLHR